MDFEQLAQEDALFPWLASDCMADLEHDDLMDADAYDRRRAERDGWQTAYWDGR